MIGQEGERQEREQKCFSSTIKYVGLKEIQASVMETFDLLLKCMS